jgi:short-subunit dehydrogenase
MDFAERYGPWAVVAGASEGVGASVARLLGALGVNVVLVSRRQELLDDVAATVATDTRTVVLDLSDADAAARLATAVADLEVGLVVYNAGADPNMSQFLDKPVDIWQGMVARNCATVVGVAHHFGGSMAARGRGGMVLVSSGAGWAGGAYLAVYGASKAFDLVLAMVLGQTDTPAFRKVLNGREVENIADPDDVARDMLDHLPEGPTFPAEPSPFGSLPRRQAVEFMTKGAAFLHD